MKHGANDSNRNVPRHPIALLLVDVINDFDFPARPARVMVPSDATAANTASLAEQALAGLELSVRADTRPADAINFEALAGELRQQTKDMP